MSREAALDELISCAATFTGFSRDAILPEAIGRALGAAPPAEVLLRARRREDAVVKLLSQAVSVGETFLFRHPEHFRYLASQFLPGRKADRLRVWSAGCATGEETWSLAACLRDLAPCPFEVLGTDLVERNLVAAREGNYGSWSRRAAGPMLHPLGQQAGDRLRIDDRLRPATRFELHNLLDAPPASGPFDVIFCRNVLVYFSPDARAVVVNRLVSALAPDGVLIFGPMDLDQAPPGFAPAANPEDQIWRRPPPPAPGRKAAPPPRPAPLPAPVPAKPVPPEPVALHLRALRQIERGERRVAERTLAELCRLVPDYVPGLVEQALLKMRAGDSSGAASLMREVLRRTDSLQPEMLLPGPEPLPVRFYRESADNFLRGTSR